MLMKVGMVPCVVCEGSRETYKDLMQSNQNRLLKRLFCVGYNLLLD
jgi:hypothetical protein